MKIIVLLCFIVGSFCFAAKDALDARTAQTAKNTELVANTDHNNSNSSSTQVIKRS